MTFAAPLEAKSIRFRARSFVAFTLTPEAPLDVWLEGLDHWIGNSPGYFAGRPVVLDLNTLKPDVAAIESLVDVLGHRGIRIYAIELDGHAALAPNLPPVLVGAKEATTDGLLPRKAREDVSEEGKAEGRAPEAGAAKAGDGKVDASKAGDSEPQVEASGTLMIKAPIRSGQAIVHPHGDVIVLGSVASGSEIIAAGSIHVYGTLRGRASAGALGNKGARIFCR
ncbi:septum site-determining protein MinC, partial [Mesorhizobium sp. M7A.F.Ca.CA.004.09.1.2]|uniref:septum site-determining protein MinC n=1 Tax=Mesorhizobium sp. M7A.F.Ca.CA.004.09.1.2 TaxID=2496695 RepID=UPI000FC9BCB1